MVSTIPSPTEPGIPESSHRHNDDLLVSADAREATRKKFPKVFFLLDTSYLLNDFVRRDELANRQKRLSRIAGFWAVVLAALGLCGAASAGVWSSWPDPAPRIVAILLAICGFSSVWLAYEHTLNGNRKSKWLFARMMTERMRQFHFQTFIWRLGDIVAVLKGDIDESNFQERRNQWLDELRRELEAARAVIMSQLLKPEMHAAVCLHGGDNLYRVPSIPADASMDLLRDVFRAYDDLRFRIQRNYAIFKLREQDDPGNEAALTRGPRRRLRLPWRWFPGMHMPPVQLRRTLDLLWSTTFVLLLALNGWVLVERLLGYDGLSQSPWVGAAIITLAITPLAIRILQDGLMLRQDEDRYADYLSAIQPVRQAFVERLNSKHEGANTVEECLQLMAEMERESYEEMRSFLRQGHAANFVF